jgi:hypothetical protein
MNMRVWVAALVVSFTFLSAGEAQEFGKMRALEQRAAHIVQLKNDFVVNVLTSYGIPHERNAQGVVVRIRIDERWLDVTAIEIVPVIMESADRQRHLTAHELLFTTAAGTLDLLSDLAIR